MFKVLVIAYYYPPLGLSGVQRTLKFTKYLKQYNWDPVVLTTGQTGYYAYDNSMLKEAEEAGIRIERVNGKEINALLSKPEPVKMPPEFLRKILSRISKTIYVPDNKNSWAKKAYERAKELIAKEKFNLIFVTAPPFSAINIAVRLKKEFGLPLVIDYRDLWFGNQFSFYPTPFHKIRNKKMEYIALKAADRIIAINRKMKEKIIDTFQFLSFEDIYIIPQGYDPKDLENLTVEKKTNSKMRITYSGIFYESITPKYFLKAFKEISKERPDIARDIELHFIGIFRKENQRLIRKLELQSFVTEFGYMDHREALGKIMASDVLWVTVGKSKNSDTISTGKAFEYIGTKKPIIVCTGEGALKTAAEEYKASFIVEPDNIKQIKEAILKVYQLYKKNELPSPDEDFVAKHRRDFLTEQLIKQFQFLVKDEIQ